MQSPRPSLNKRVSGGLVDRNGRFSPSPHPPHSRLGISHTGTNNNNCGCQNCNCNCHSAQASSPPPAMTELSALLHKSSPAPTGSHTVSIAGTEHSSSSQSPPAAAAAAPISWLEKIPYYLPCLTWLPNYDTDKCLRDFVSGVSLASFQIPLAMSYAKTIAHVPPICGLLAVAVTPVVYSVFGSIPQMIVGPEPSISIVVGGVVEPMLLHGGKDVNAMDLVLVISCLSGFMLLGSGLARFGFLDTVLSVALLKGFIAAVGFVMICNSSVEELGLKLTPQDHVHSPYDKVKFVVSHFNESQLDTTMISVAILFSLLFAKLLKRKLMQRGYDKVIFFPEILITVILTTFLSYQLDWESKGISVVGKIHSVKNFYWSFPFNHRILKYYKPLVGSALTCAILGFFESTTASKALGAETPISSNRELVALGFINIVGGTFGSLPAFGGYGRSKINMLSGGITSASGAFMGLTTIFVIVFLIPYLYYLPNCCLSCITTMVGITILEEIPKDLIFFIRTKGWEEIITFLITFMFAFFYSMDSGIIMGTSYSIIRILKNSSQSRIQILKRVPGTSTEFINANSTGYKRNNDDSSAADIDTEVTLEDIENCLIVKIPEPLIFTNTNDLKLKLKRLEMYGSTQFHPATPAFKPHLHCIIFDINEMVDLDSSSAQILLELIKNYFQRRIRIYLVTKKRNPKIDAMLIRSGIAEYIELRSISEMYFNSIEDVLKIVDQDQEFSEVASYKSTIPEYI